MSLNTCRTSYMYKCMKYDSDILHSFFETDQNAKFDWLREG